MTVSSSEDLRHSIIHALYKQGYKIKNGVICLPENPSKDDYRALNELARQKKMEKSGPALYRHEDRLIQYIADGSEVIPHAISPKFVLVEPKTEHELLFRYACLHWSIPVSSGYGRRLRFLVFDDSNGKLIGLFGLGDPVYSIKARDQWIGWDKESKAHKLYHVMDAYVLGAVPPYSYLLGGKLVAMLVCSNEVRDEFRKKYSDQESLIKKAKRPPFLAVVTTTSALGRSSIYNRIKANGYQYWDSLGYTKGSGDFHFSNGVYEDIRRFVEEHCKPTAKNASWGNGFRNKREVVRKCLAGLGLSSDLIYHGIKREVLAAPLGKNALPFLRREVGDPACYDWPASMLVRIFMKRWLLGRAQRRPEFRNYVREQYRLWPL
jgi:hypothetical protein